MPNNFGVRMTNDIFVINIEPEIERSASNKVLNDMPIRVLLIASSLRLNLVHTGHDCHAVACSQTGIFIYRSIDSAILFRSSFVIPMEFDCEPLQASFNVHRIPIRFVS